MSPIEFFLCFTLVILSAFLNSSEVVLFSLSKFQIRHLREHFPKAYTRIKTLLADASGILITILIANELVNITFSTVVANIISREWTSISEIIEPVNVFGWPDWVLQILAGIILASPILLFLCEITPKVIATRMNQVVAPVSVGSLSRLYALFFPARAILQKLLFLIEGRSSTPTSDSPLKEDEFMIMVEEGHKEGLIQKAEVGLIRGVFEMDDRSVESVITPIHKAQSVAARTAIKEAIKILERKRFFRVPVTGKSKKDVVGILYTKDLILAKLQPSVLNSPVESIMRKPFTVRSNMRLSTLFRHMKQQKKHLAIVESEKEEFIGIVTMQDILDHLFTSERVARK